MPVLLNLRGMPEGPEPDERLVSDWSAASFDRYFAAVARRRANTSARRAGECQATGAWAMRWHDTRHEAALSWLAHAETSAPKEDRAWHAARLDAYAAAHGLRGWYRVTDHRGKHVIQINKLRTREEGEAGRYFTHHADLMHGPACFWVIDRDTGRTAYRATHHKIAAQWITTHEAAAPTPSHAEPGGGW